jgi:hypothetical protein
MVRVVRSRKFSLNIEAKAKLAARTEIEKSNISLKGEYLRHKKKVKLAPLKFLERNKDEKPKSA